MNCQKTRNVHFPNFNNFETNALPFIMLVDCNNKYLICYCMEIHSVNRRGLVCVKSCFAPGGGGGGVSNGFIMRRRSLFVPVDALDFCFHTSLEGYLWIIHYL